MQPGDIPGWLGLGIALWSMWLHWKSSLPSLYVRAGLNRRRKTSQGTVGPKFLAIRVVNDGSRPTTITGFEIVDRTTKDEQKFFGELRGRAEDLPCHLIPGGHWDALFLQDDTLEEILRRAPNSRVEIRHALDGGKPVIGEIVADSSELPLSDLPMPSEEDLQKLGFL
jgi:hypothetical protein